MVLSLISADMLSAFVKNFYQKWYELPNEIKQLIVWPNSYNPDGPIYGGLIERIPGKKRKYSSMDQEISILEYWIGEYRFLMSKVKISQFTFQNPIENHCFLLERYYLSELFIGFDLSVVAIPHPHPKKNMTSFGL